MNISRKGKNTYIIQGIISAKPFMVSQFFGVLVCKDQIGAHVGYQLEGREPLWVSAIVVVVLLPTHDGLN
jgi:hypothetical protein